MRYKLRTLLILLAIMPPLLWFGWTKYEAWRREQARLKAAAEMEAEIDRLLLQAKLMTGAGPPGSPPSKAPLGSSQPAMGPPTPFSGSESPPTLRRPGE